MKMGVDTVSLDNYCAGKHSNLEHLACYQNFREVKCDITDFRDLERQFEGIEVVFHQAASKKVVSLENPRRDLEVNAEGTFNLLELSRKYGVRKFIHASTGSVYGEPTYSPQDERHPLKPTSYYGVSKLAAEKYVEVFSHLYGLDTTILRYFHVYGPRQDSTEKGGVVAIFTRRMLEGQPIVIFGDGTQQRSFTYVGDVVHANILAATTAGTKGEVFNCASGLRVTITELARMIAEILGVEDLRIVKKGWQPGDIKLFDVDNSKIMKTLGMNFMTDFRKGLAITIEWARQRP